jgi:hypothetical protein
MLCFRGHYKVLGGVILGFTGPWLGIAGEKTGEKAENQISGFKNAENMNENRRTFFKTRERIRDLPSNSPHIM